MKLEKRAIIFGVKDLNYSNNKSKKYVVTVNNKKFTLVIKGMTIIPYTKMKKRRKNFRPRASNKNGQLMYKDINTPNYWSYLLLW